MRIAVPKEIVSGERRVALVPETCKKLIKTGAEIAVEAGAGQAAYFADEDFCTAGATIVPPCSCRSLNVPARFPRTGSGEPRCLALPA